MASDWSIQKLGQAGVALIDCDHRTPPAAETGFPYVAIPQLKEGRIELSGVRRISREHFIEWTKKAKPQEHDVVLSRRCNPGVTAHVPAGLEMALGQNLVLLRADGSKMHPPFIRWLASGQEWWDQVGKFINVGAVFESLRCRDIPGFELTIPPLTEQKRIAHILGTLDEKIELNHRMSATLEAMAQAFFQSWFVDFDPVRRNAEGGSLGQKDSRFPDSFEDSVIGEIPKGWTVGTIETATSLIIDYRGKTPKKLGSDWSLAGIPAVSAKNVKGGRLVRPDTFNFVDEELYEKWMKDKLTKGDVLMTSEAPLGELYYLALDARYCLSQRVFALRADPSCCESTFLYHWLSLPSCQTEMAGRGTGSTVVGIRQSELRKVRMLLPPLAVQKAASRFLTPWVEQVHRNEDQNRNLAALRDALLPKLLRGEL